MWKNKHIFSSKKGEEQDGESNDTTVDGKQAEDEDDDARRGDSLRTKLPSLFSSLTKSDASTQEEEETAKPSSQDALTSMSSMLPSFLTSSSKGDIKTDASCNSKDEVEVEGVEEGQQSQSDTEKYMFDETYTWPNLFKEADDMLQASLLIYAFADLRRLARSGKLVEGADEAVFNLPIPAIVCMKVIEQNEEALAKFNDEADIKICREALRAIHERCEVSDEGVEVSEDMLSMSTLVAFGDENSDKELVYAVAVDKWYKRITVAFRGSVTQKDFITDACISMISKENPVHGFAHDQDEEIKLHSGFYSYLLENKGKEQEKSKFDEVMGIVDPLLEKYPGYKLYVTGHSLGGALATLFSFEAVTTTAYDIPSPVTCVSVASPKLGNESFRKAFQLLEEKGELRHLRIANEKDPVTLGPPASSKVMLASLSPATLMVLSSVSNTIENELYKHVGMRLKLLSDEKKRFKLSFSTGSWRQDLFHPAVSVYHHLGYEYSTRMLRTKCDLEPLSLNSVYKSEANSQSTE